jgi:hypothetical protein
MNVIVVHGRLSWLQSRGPDELTNTEYVPPFYDQETRLNCSNSISHAHAVDILQEFLSPVDTSAENNSLSYAAAHVSFQCNSSHYLNW